MRTMVHLKGIGRTAALAGILLSGPALVFAQVSGHDGHDKAAPAEAAPATASSHGPGHGQDSAGPAETPAAGHGGGYGAHSGWPEPGKLGGDFSLTDHTGRKVTLADFKGKATALYFGYTQCGDICPIIGTKLGMAVDLMGDKADQVNIAMISVDDRNDGPAQLAAFVAKQHPRLIGLSGTRKEIYDIAALYRVRRDYVAQNQVAKEGEAPASAEPTVRLTARRRPSLTPSRRQHRCWRWWPRMPVTIPLRHRASGSESARLPTMRRGCTTWRWPIRPTSTC
jgi:cytochrome oxidase Cu insertion factor (SCO1/SenC/PrrC family)